MNKYKLKGAILSPLHIGTGNQIEPFDYVIKNGKLYRISLEDFLCQLSEEKRKIFEDIVDSGNLNRIRKYIIEEIAPQIGISCYERNIEPYDVYTAQEAFMTGTPFCMLPVVSLNGIKIGKGVPGFNFNHLLKKWGDNVGVDIKNQIKEWDKSNEDIPGTSPYKFK